MGALRGYYSVSLAQPNGDYGLNDQYAEGIWGVMGRRGLQGLSLRDVPFPRFQARHEPLNIQAGTTAITISLAVPNQLNVDSSQIWIASGILNYEDPQWLEIIYGNQSYFWKRVEPKGNNGPVHRLRTTRGLLFRFDGTKRPANGLYGVPLRTEKAKTPPTADGQVNACLNPLIMYFDCLGREANDTPQEFSDFRTHFRQSEQLLDLVPDLADEAWLPIKWSQHIAQREPKKNGDRPVVCKLMFQSSWHPGYVPFFLLDQLGGRFFIDGFASKRGAKMAWERPAAESPDNEQWLTSWCLEKMGINELVDRPREIVTRSDFATIADDYTSHDGLKLDANRLPTANNAHPIVAWVAKQSEATPEPERDFIRYLADRAMGSDRRFVILLATERLMPRSAVNAYLPDVPECLERANRSLSDQWRKHRGSVVVNLLQSPVHAEVWWVENLWEYPHSDPADDNDPWLANGASWWYRFYRGLFSKPGDYVPEWQVHLPSLLGKEKLGSLVLGDRAMARTVSLTRFRLH